MKSSDNFLFRLWLQSNKRLDIFSSAFNFRSLGDGVALQDSIWQNKTGNYRPRAYQKLLYYLQAEETSIPRTHQQKNQIV